MLLLEGVSPIHFQQIFGHLLQFQSFARVGICVAELGMRFCLDPWCDLTPMVFTQNLEMPQVGQPLRGAVKLTGLVEAHFWLGFSGCKLWKPQH